ncbi:histidine phosphatase family protein [Mucilaginibacter sp. UR6-11]|uniref:SixA phosphatase family protein n=1 Tax=Mucilaginibacter sp. UR6-11 TaxID=1435644 RepID=UPI001E395DF0|nr:histidine phosphatase family protein [Mucilaginibacter sp. UR6-11]MCC8426669.1 histidine phosphatase family protein [Mucilaginibacter sp. UR6-11]
MKKLLLVRHAKATHETGFVDFERPLKPSGLQNAAIMAGRLKEHNLLPQILVASPALRTISTANVFSQHLAIPKSEEIMGIYEASQDQLVDIISQLSDEYDFVGLVGHNPAIAQVLHYLTDEVHDVPPGAVALIEFELDTWAAVSGSAGKLIFYDSPKG